MTACISRREFITLLGGAAAWPLAARAQPSDRVGVLANLLESDPEAVARFSAFRKALQELGWVEGRNLRIDTRWGVDNDRIRRNAAELVALSPDVILSNAPPSVMALQQVTQSVPARCSRRCRHSLGRLALTCRRRAGGLYGEKLGKFLGSATFHCALTAHRAAASVEA
jgi:hypothetical protein